jgi:DNA primase
MNSGIEALKQINLVEFLSRHYGLDFRRRGAAYYACCSPFSSERHPSFFVRLVDGHWLFKDFSSGAGGTIFDFVQMKEKLGSFAETLAYLGEILGSSFSAIAQGESREGDSGDAEAPAGERPYEVNALYERFLKDDPSVCREYLLRRGIDSGIVERLIETGTVVHNRHGGRSYCTFAVRNAAGELRCLDNHAVDGHGKFVLGPKSPFSSEWEDLRRARRVFLTEGIIDYLSVKTLERRPPPGLALLGNKLCFDAGLLEKAEQILAATDEDRGGYSAVLDLKERYPEKEVRVYDLEGHKDPNALLVAVRSGKGRKLSPERKLELYREFQQSENKAELARRWGIDRSHLYEIVRECEQILVEAFSGRRPGRPPKGKPTTLEAALERIEKLEEEYEREATEKEEQCCRSEFLALRLKWAEIEAREARGESVEGVGGGAKKRQIKKKKRRRRSK